MIAANPGSASIRNMFLYRYFCHHPIATKSSLVAIRERIRCKRQRAGGADAS